MINKSNDDILAMTWRVLFVFASFFGICTLIEFFEPYGRTWSLIGMFSMIYFLYKLSSVEWALEKKKQIEE